MRLCDPVDVLHFVIRACRSLWAFIERFSSYIVDGGSSGENGREPFRFRRYNRTEAAENCLFGW